MIVARLSLAVRVCSRPSILSFDTLDEGHLPGEDFWR
jgi:hypothetical protein